MKEELCNFLTCIFGLAAFYFYFDHNILWTIICLFFAVLMFFLKTTVAKRYSQSKRIKKANNNEAVYSKKETLTKSEKEFLEKLKGLGPEYIIIPQVNLASVINKSNSKYHNELFRNIDFGIFNKNYELLLLIELNDATHQKLQRKDRDLKVKKILNDCNIPLLTFYTYYPNEKDYVINRILKTINGNDETKNKDS